MSDEAERRPRGRRARRLTPEEQALWREFTRAVKPIRMRKKPAAGSGTATVAPAAAPADDAAAPSRPQPPSAHSPRQAPPAARPAVSPPARPPLAPLGRRLVHRIARGNAALDGRIDLHGLTQAEAHAALLRFLRGAQAGGDKTVLVITGKGARAASGDAQPGSGRGVLHRLVPQWLGLPEFRLLVVGFEPAHASHGGGGALYVRVRRPR